MSHDQISHCHPNVIDGRLYYRERVYTIADKFGHFYTLELVMVHCCSLPAACAHPRKVQRHHPMDIYKIRH
jgi:hypothetical protein